MLSQQEIENRLITITEFLELPPNKVTSHSIGLSDAYQSILELTDREVGELIKRGRQ